MTVMLFCWEKHHPKRDGKPNGFIKVISMGDISWESKRDGHHGFIHTNGSGIYIYTYVHILDVLASI